MCVCVCVCVCVFNNLYQLLILMQSIYIYICKRGDYDLHHKSCGICPSFLKGRQLNLQKCKKSNIQ